MMEVCFYLVHFINICGFFPPLFSIPRVPSPLFKNLKNMRLTFQILRALEIHFWSSLCEEGMKANNQLKVSF